MIIALILNVAFVGLAYQTYKALLAYRQITGQSRVVWTREMKNQRKTNQELLVRILLKWITSILFVKSFWMVESVMIFLPTSLIKLWLGLWIMLPNFHGEFFLYNLFSDKLDKFEFQVRVSRNWLVQKLMFVSFKISYLCFKAFKPYIRSEYLNGFKTQLEELDGAIDRELALRKKIMSDRERTDQMIRDSSVLTPAQNRQFKEESSYPGLYKGSASKKLNINASGQRQKEAQGNSLNTSTIIGRMKQATRGTKESKVEGSSDSIQRTQAQKASREPNKQSIILDNSLEDLDFFESDSKKTMTMSFIPTIEKSYEALSNSHSGKNNEGRISARKGVNNATVQRRSLTKKDKDL